MRDFEGARPKWPHFTYRSALQADRCQAQAPTAQSSARAHARRTNRQLQRAVRPSTKHFHGNGEPTDSHAHSGSRTNPEPLEEPRRHVPPVAPRDRGPARGDERYGRARDEDCAPAVDVAERGPEERAGGEAEGRDGDGPVHLRQGDCELLLDVWEGGDGCCCYVGEEEVPCEKRLVVEF